MRRALALSLFLTLGLPGTPYAQADDSPDTLPVELRGWQDWVLDGREHLRCPYLGGADASAPDGRICAWPGPVAIDAGETGARFAQDLQMYAPGFAPVPGDVEYWPQDVEVDGRATPVIERGGRPHLRLERGTHRIAGRLVWVRMPESIPLPSSVSLVELRVNGASIALPERSGDRLRLGAARVQAQVNQLEVQVYRKLTDSLPAVLETRVLLNVAGQAREELLGPILPPGFVPMHLTGPLPARLQPDGRLRVQVRPGSFPLVLVSRAVSALEAVRLPEAGLSEEVWSFEAVDRLRSAAVEGVPGIDPAQANVPGEWQSLPAYRLSPGSELRIVERSRGLGGEDQNRVSVERQLWWDFDGSGYTFQDFVGGRMQQGWRLEMSPPYLLQGARQGGQPLLVTQREEGRAGVELRSPELGIEATGRLEKRGGAIPAAGWDTRLTSLGVTLQLPPGHRLLAAPGVDESASAWLNRWRLLDIFLVLLVTAAAFRVAGVPAAVLALAALTLTHHELPALTWGVLNLVIAIGLARAVPDGRLRRWVGIWRAVSAAVVVLMLVPFSLSQARLAFFPQLESPGLIEMPLSAPERAASPASAPPMEDEGQVMEARDAALAGAVSQITVTAAKRSEVYRTTDALMQRYAPGTLLQNGPGVPRWNYQSHRLQWGGPVEATQTLRLIVLRPFWVSLWRLAGIVLLSLTLYALLRNAYPRIGQPLIDRWLRLAPAAAALLAMALPLAAPDARAETPSAELLGELQRRLSRPPKCEPDCVVVARAQLRLAGDVLEIRLEAHAQALAVLALPEAAQRWQPQQVLLDGAPASGLARDSSGTLVLALAPGVHTVSMRGPVPEADAVRLVFRERPARIGVDAPGWQVAGVDEERLLADSVSLIRPVNARADAGADTTSREEFPPFVRVTRTLRLGLDWTVTTDVQRLAPAQGAFSLRLPLLAGESVLTAGLPARDGHVELSMPAGVDHAGWTSTLARAESISLAAPAAATYVETWRFEVAPIWHLAFEGTPEVLGPQQDGPSWVHHFEPRSAESLEVTVTRPAAVAGPTFAFERVRHALTPGRRSTDTTLEIDYRSTQGERHVLELPEGARLQSVLADGEPLLLRDQDGELALPLQPGEHQLQIAWQADVGTSLVTRPGAVGLGAPASNVQTTIAVPANRWLLFAAGGGVGPAILYWAELAVFIVLALLLGRLRRTPLATHEWLLVGLGLSTFSWSVLLLFAVWVFVFEWRSRWTADTRPWVFNGVQLLLVLLTLAALGSLLAAIPNGLLGSPDMRVAGAGSHGGLLDWFHDRVEPALPQPFVISVSIWFYKAAMLAWALWLSFALVRWVRWAWQAGSAQGFWRGRRPAAPQIG
jgi:hypothetical protein